MRLAILRRNRCFDLQPAASSPFVLCHRDSRWGGDGAGRARAQLPALGRLTQTGTQAARAIRWHHTLTRTGLIGDTQLASNVFDGQRLTGPGHQVISGDERRNRSAREQRRVPVAQVAPNLPVSEHAFRLGGGRPDRNNCDSAVAELGCHVGREPVQRRLDDGIRNYRFRPRRLRPHGPV
jgi:hypothetical protein